MNFKLHIHSQIEVDTAQLSEILNSTCSSPKLFLIVKITKRIEKIRVRHNLQSFQIIRCCWKHHLNKHVQNGGKQLFRSLTFSIISASHIMCEASEDVKSVISWSISWLRSTSMLCPPEAFDLLPFIRSIPQRQLDLGWAGRCKLCNDLALYRSCCWLFVVFCRSKHIFFFVLENTG